MKKIRNPWEHKEGYNCFGCAPGNPVGLHLEFYEDADDIVSVWHPSANYQGWIETLHGGIISTLVDETSAWAITRKLQTIGVTVRLEMKFRHPVMTTAGEVTVRAHIANQRARFVTVETTVESEGNICATGTAVFCVEPQEKAFDMGFDGCKTEDEP